MKEGSEQRVIITGGAGFIGSALILHLLEHTSYHILNLDALTYAGNPESLNSIRDHPRYEFRRVNITDRRALAGAFSDFNPNGVFHLAAESHVDRSIEGSRAFIDTNVIGTHTLLEVTRQFLSHTSKTQAEGFRLLHISTDEVYGDLSETDPAFTESHRYAPSSPYSASKAASDHLVRAWARTYGLPVLITNCSNNYGPRQFPEKLIPHMILNAISGKPLPVYGDGGQIRDWLHVEDHADALLTVYERGRPGETYNVGGNHEMRNITLIETLCDLLDQHPEAKVHQHGGSFRRLITFVTDRPGHDRRYAIDLSKIRSELGWSPSHTFEQGLAETIDWYLENTTWWKRILSGDYQLERIGTNEPS